MTWFLKKFPRCVSPALGLRKLYAPPSGLGAVAWGLLQSGQGWPVSDGRLGFRGFLDRNLWFCDFLHGCRWGWLNPLWLSLEMFAGVTSCVIYTVYYDVLLPFQIKRRFGFFKCVVFATHLDIHYVYIHSKNNLSRKAKTSHITREVLFLLNL
ncbi:peptidyl-prolyl cis-trans isomerases [Zea mays]|jgi:hypothetical protein|uniref:Peptidyl-prolyl cis-trans isomerases n=1 Tax=Zea mays TaxID=4577 RepID=A0A1D6PMN6_MAIZE|nr:peptidyl-prolyl cis-trans isomerases [Zea mays]